MSYGLTQAQRDLIEWLREPKHKRRETMEQDKLAAIFDMQYALDQRIMTSAGSKRQRKNGYSV